MNEASTGTRQAGQQRTSTAGLVVLMMAKGGAYVLASLAMWPVLAWAITGRAPIGTSADPLAGVFGVLGATFAAAACLAFVISRPRTPQPGLRNLMGVGIGAAGVLLVAQALIAVDIIRRNVPASASTAEAAADTGVLPVPAEPDGATAGPAAGGAAVNETTAVD